MVMPRMSARVVCTFGVTMEILAPTSALISVDLPTFGAPISATNPQRVPARPPAPAAPAQPLRRAVLHALARQHGGGGGLFGGALGASRAFRRGKVGKLHGDAEFGIVVGAGARHFAIGRRRQSARLRPFLQDRLGIAQRLRLRLHARLPQPLDQSRRRRIAAVEIDRADQRLADIGENGGTLAGAGIDLR